MRESPAEMPPRGSPTGEGDIPLPADGPDQEESAGARPADSGPMDEPRSQIRDSRPWTIVGLVLLVIFLAILAYAVVLPALH